MSAPTKAAVRKSELERFRLDGGSLVVYPPAKSGKEMAGMVTVWLSDERPAYPATRVVPIPLAPARSK